MDNVELKQAVIIAGGLGTRLKPFTDTSPKPMYPFYGKPFIQYLVEQIRSFGIHRVLILLGYMPEKIQGVLGDGADLGVDIHYDVTPVEYDTGARLRHAEPLLDEQFLFMYCDNYCPIDVQKLFTEWTEHEAFIQLSVYQNADHYTKDNVCLNKTGQVLIYDKDRKSRGLSGVDIGYAIISKKVFQYLDEGNVNFERSVYAKIVEQKRMYATVTKHWYYSIGSWERIKLTEEFFSGRKTVFLDRDGTLNVKPLKACYVERPEDFIWLDGAMEAVLRLNQNGYRVIVISNQPGIARGKLSTKALEAIHGKMRQNLNEIGAKIDAIYYCPHGWDEGCDCRKPNPGLLYQAQKDFSLDLTKCYMVGDDERDMQAGRTAGCKCVQVTDSYSLKNAVDDILTGEI